jgi:hypothetical protein
MKALTLHQPHATLMALGKKPWETRCWQAPPSLIGQPLAIHAGKKFDLQCRGEDRIAWALGRFADDTSLLPYGGIVAVVLLLDCRESTDTDRRRNRYQWTRQNRPEYFGDFSQGRYVWETELLLRVHPHIVCRGYQRLWNVPTAIEAVLTEELAA